MTNGFLINFAAEYWITMTPFSENHRAIAKQKWTNEKLTY
jgi:hypothetical protein